MIQKQVTTLAIRILVGGCIFFIMASTQNSDLVTRDKVCKFLKQEELMDKNCSCDTIELERLSAVQNELYFASFRCNTGTGGNHNFLLKVNPNKTEVSYFFQGYVDSIDKKDNSLIKVYYKKVDVKNFYFSIVTYNANNNKVTDSLLAHSKTVR
jgi:hypothetical protein